MNALDKWNNTVLIRAVKSVRTEIVKLLLKNKVDMNIWNNDGFTALIQAAKSGCTEIVKILIAGGADINALDNENNTALIGAAKSTRSESVELLLKHGADVFQKNKSNETFLSYYLRYSLFDNNPSNNEILILALEAIGLDKIDSYLLEYDLKSANILHKSPELMKIWNVALESLKSRQRVEDYIKTEQNAENDSKDNRHKFILFNSWESNSI